MYFLPLIIPDNQDYTIYLKAFLVIQIIFIPTSKKPEEQIPYNMPGSHQKGNVQDV
jgi:hypothetical protein